MSVFCSHLQTETEISVTTGALSPSDTSLAPTAKSGQDQVFLASVASTVVPQVMKAALLSQGKGLSSHDAFTSLSLCIFYVKIFFLSPTVGDLRGLCDGRDRVWRLAFVWRPDHGYLWNLHSDFDETWSIVFLGY